jgi:hypothetical protein
LYFVLFCHHHRCRRYLIDHPAQIIITDSIIKTSGGIDTSSLRLILLLL